MTQGLTGAKGLAAKALLLTAAFLPTACQTPVYGTPPSASVELETELEALGLPNAGHISFNLARPPRDTYRDDYQEKMDEFEVQRALLIQAVKNNPAAIIALSEAYDDARDRHNASTDLEVKAAANKEMENIRAQVAVIASVTPTSPQPE